MEINIWAHNFVLTKITVSQADVPISQSAQEIQTSTIWSNSCVQKAHCATNPECSLMNFCYLSVSVCIHACAHVSYFLTVQPPNYEAVTTQSDSSDQSLLSRGNTADIIVTREGISIILKRGSLTDEQVTTQCLHCDNLI